MSDVLSSNDAAADMAASAHATFSYTIHINGSAEDVFAALTVPARTRHYWGDGNLSDWRPGSAWQHMRSAELGTPELVGTVIANEMPRRLALTWANASEAHDAAAYSCVVFEVEPSGADRVRLTLTHSGLEPGGGMLAGISRGWPVVLSGLKSFVETGRGSGH